MQHLTGLSLDTARHARPFPARMRFARRVSRRTTVVTAVTLLTTAALSASLAAAQETQPAADSTAERQQQLQAGIEAFLAESGVPGIGAALVMVDEPTVIAVAGRRAAGDETAVTIDDLWHLGSISKSFTATLTARLIERPTELGTASEQGRLDWTTPLGELLATAVETPFEDVPLRLFLGHRSGLVANPPMSTFAQRDVKTPIREQRDAIVAELLAIAPASDPDTAMLYSNAGYIVVGTALEHLLDASWEELMRREVFAPLGLDSGGFGPPGSVDVVDQPRGHSGTDNAELRPVPPTPIADNPAFLGPAGTIHMSIGDLATYARAHLEGELGEDGIVSSNTFRTLHRSLEGQSYALGWVHFPDGEGPAATIPGDLYFHNGSNTIWYATLFIAPEERMAVAVTINAGIHNARLVDTLALELMKDFGSATTPDDVP